MDTQVSDDVVLVGIHYFSELVAYLGSYSTCRSMYNAQKSKTVLIMTVDCPKASIRETTQS